MDYDKDVDLLVARGIVFLDEDCPDWMNIFCLSKFNIFNGNCCVIGQCYRDRLASHDQDTRSTFARFVVDRFGAWNTKAMIWTKSKGFDAVSEQQGLLLQRAWETRIVEITVFSIERNSSPLLS